jgi:hypothetical protein
MPIGSTPFRMGQTDEPSKQSSQVTRFSLRKASWVDINRESRAPDTKIADWQEKGSGLLAVPGEVAISVWRTMVASRGKGIERHVRIGSESAHASSAVRGQS